MSFAVRFFYWAFTLYDVADFMARCPWDHTWTTLGWGRIQKIRIIRSQWSNVKRTEEGEFGRRVLVIALDGREREVLLHNGKVLDSGPGGAGFKLHWMKKTHGVKIWRKDMFFCFTLSTTLSCFFRFQSICLHSTYQREVKMAFMELNMYILWLSIGMKSVLLLYY